jgi:NDP-sugar pyrophosphorylase family protein
MDAFILGASGGTDDLARPIVGAPLLVRQIEWLRASGARRVVVNRVADAASARDLGSPDEAKIGVEVVWIPSAEPLARAELARRVGLREGIVAVLAHAVVGDVDLRPLAAQATRTGADVTVRVGDLDLELWHAGEGLRERVTVQAAGWLRLVGSERDAQVLNEDILMGRVVGIEVRGSEIRKGVWTSRGAIAVDGARLEPPCYLGPDSFVASGAVIGPGAVLGRHAVVEQGAIVTHARVADGVIVGRDVVVSNACALDGKLLRYDGVEIELDDSLLVGSAVSVSLGSRLAAGVALVAVFLPALAFGRAARATSSLGRVVWGSGAWVGLRPQEGDELPVFDIESQLVPSDATDEVRAAARAFYLAKKSPGLDARLLAGLLVRHSPKVAS